MPRVKILRTVDVPQDREIATRYPAGWEGEVPAKAAAALVKEGAAEKVEDKAEG
jgi:hypothetical protein